MIIGLAGKKQNGKSTVADYLTVDHKFVEVSWAGPLKQIIGMGLLGLKEHQVYGTLEDKETVDEFWGKSPRELLQIIGTDCFRNLVDPEFWVKVGIRDINLMTNSGFDVVVSDCRFPNEIEAIKNLGGQRS